MDILVIWGKREGKYFCRRGWTATSLICPSGTSVNSRMAPTGPRQPEIQRAIFHVPVIPG
jgi:hypothetical protein